MSAPKKQFSRDSIHLFASSSVRREWREVEVKDLSSGDTVAGIGTLQSVVVHGDGGVDVCNVAGNVTSFSTKSHKVFAFTEAESSAQ